LGIRKLTGSFFEIRAGLDIRLVFQNRAECLLFVMAGNHAEVQKFLREGAEYVIKDLSSRNGTWVHGHRALTARLRHNDCILAGHTLFRFCEERAGVSPALQPVSGPHGTKILFPAASTGPDRTAADS
jgi:hypothetical protein